MNLNFGVDMTKYKKVLSIAGSDSGGGAGIQADIKAISACGCYAATAITAITVQNTLGVDAVEAITAPTVAAQIRAVASDIGIDAVKIGMLHSSEVILAIKSALSEYKISNIVLDPVMVSTSGHKLIEADAIATLKTELIPISRIITPNIPEAEILLDESITTQDSMRNAAKKLGHKFNVAVLLKAGHRADDTLIDYLYDPKCNRLIEYPSPRIDSINTHGTGCTLSSAIAAYLAQGYPLSEACKLAKEYISKAIEYGATYQIGGGHGPVHHFWKWWK